MDSNLKAGFRYTTEVIRNGKVVSTDMAENLIPIEGLDHLINVTLKADTPVTSWYVGLYKGNYTPTSGVTAATIVALANEATSYDEDNRVQWVGGTVAAGAVDNALSEAEFTFNATENVYGAFLISSDTKGSGTGTLLSVVRFPTVKAMENTDTLRITVGFAAISA